MKINTPGDDELAALRRRVDALEKGAPMGYSSITRGSLRVASVEGLLVEGSERVTGLLLVDGTLQVTGVQTVSGTLVISGGQIINGTFVINGTTTVNGPSTFVGNVGITGMLNITGATTITGTVTVTGGGELRIGSLVISPSAASGSGLYGPVMVQLDTPLVDVTQSLGVGQALVVQGATVLESLVNMTGLPPAPPGAVANCYIDPSTGRVHVI